MTIRVVSLCFEKVLGNPNYCGDSWFGMYTQSSAENGRYPAMEPAWTVLENDSKGRI